MKDKQVNFIYEQRKMRSVCKSQMLNDRREEQDTLTILILFRD